VFTDCGLRRGVQLLQKDVNRLQDSRLLGREALIEFLNFFGVGVFLEL